MRTLRSHRLRFFCLLFVGGGAGGRRGGHRMGSWGTGETGVPQCGEQRGPQASEEGLARRSHASVGPETWVACTRVWSVGQVTAAGHPPQCPSWISLLHLPHLSPGPLACWPWPRMRQGVAHPSHSQSRCGLSSQVSGDPKLSRASRLMGGLEPELAIRYRRAGAEVPGAWRAGRLSCRNCPVRTEGDTLTWSFGTCPLSSLLLCSSWRPQRSVHWIRRQTPARPGDALPWRPVLLGRGQWLSPACRPSVCAVPGTQRLSGLTGAFAAAALPPGS